MDRKMHPAPADDRIGTASRDVTAVVLCGGRGSRLGGVDKGLLEVEGAALIDSLVARLQPRVHSVLISANRNLEAYATRGHRIVVDAFDDCGPLAGVHAALSACPTDYLFVCPADAPGLDGAIVAALRARIGARDAIHLRDGTRAQALHALIHVRLADSLAEFLAAGGRAVHAWLRAVDAIDVDLRLPAETFHNINTPDDLRAWQARRDTAGDPSQR
ncbi:MAG TPA: molybdenum cofactor guanylyltransferase MobA [Pseudomonadales bacterium]|nr:molybdenum cofactor guanylyltransferase MobA [Pseudomonadales bacterium]